MIWGDFPPSSKENCLSVAAPVLRMLRVVLPSPVKAILSTSGCSTKYSPAPPLPYPGTTLITPGGKPASSKILASSIAVTGVNSAGFRTTVHPAARAGPSFQAVVSNGAFHGVIAPTTPTGRREVKMCTDSSIGIDWPQILSANEANH